MQVHIYINYIDMNNKFMNKTLYLAVGMILIQSFSNCCTMKDRMSGGMKEVVTFKEEVDILNNLFEEERGAFDFNNMEVGFIEIGGRFGKAPYFDMIKNHDKNPNVAYDKGMLYVFTKEQKQISGGYDAAIVYWSKFQLPVNKVLKILHEHSGNGGID